MCRDIDSEPVPNCTSQRRYWCVLGIVLVLLLAYVGSYWHFSRRGFAAADEYGLKGLFFYLPDDTAEWERKEMALRVLNLPLIYVDCWIGTGRSPGSPPTFARPTSGVAIRFTQHDN